LASVRIVVAVVEDLGARVLKADHRLDLRCHRLPRRIGEALRVRLRRSAFHVLERVLDGQVASGSCALVWSVTMSMAAPRASSSGNTSPALPSSPIDSGRFASRAASASSSASIEVASYVEVAMLDAARDAGRVDVDADRDAVVHRDASGCAPPIPPRPAVRVMVPGQRAAEPLGRDGGERLVGALQDALGADVDPRARRHLAVHGQPELPPGGGTRPSWPSRRPGSSWRSARAAPTRGCASTPTGLPDWTSMVSSFFEVVRVRTIASKLFQSRAALPVPP
jgi:hypothetical protein